MLWIKKKKIEISSLLDAYQRRFSVILERGKWFIRHDSMYNHRTEFWEACEVIEFLEDRKWGMND